VAKELAWEQMKPAQYRRLGVDTIVSCEGERAGISLLLLTCRLKFARPGRQEQKSSCRNPETGRSKRPG